MKIIESYVVLRKGIADLRQNKPVDLIQMQDALDALKPAMRHRIRVNTLLRKHKK